MLRNRTVLVTGGAGFIGSEVVRHTAGGSRRGSYGSRQSGQRQVVRPFNAFGPRSHHEGDCGEVIARWRAARCSSMAMAYRRAISPVASRSLSMNFGSLES
jgi:nucleoside-diphosphate-sugar epimerase